MNTEEIIDMAREIAGQYSKAERFQTWTHDYMMQRLMELVAAEREACAKFIEDGYVRQFENPWREDLAAAIRNRGDL